MKHPSNLFFEEVNPATNNYSESNNINISSSYYSVRMRSSGEKVRIPDETNHFQSASYTHSNNMSMRSGTVNHAAACD